MSCYIVLMGFLFAHLIGISMYQSISLSFILVSLLNPEDIFLSTHPGRLAQCLPLKTIMDLQISDKKSANQWSKKDLQKRFGQSFQSRDLFWICMVMLGCRLKLENMIYNLKKQEDLLCKEDVEDGSKEIVKMCEWPMIFMPTDDQFSFVLTNMLFWGVIFLFLLSVLLTMDLYCWLIMVWSIHLRRLCVCPSRNRKTESAWIDSFSELCALKCWLQCFVSQMMTSLSLYLSLHLDFSLHL